MNLGLRLTFGWHGWVAKSCEPGMRSDQMKKCEREEDAEQEQKKKKTKVRACMGEKIEVEWPRQPTC